MSTVAAVLLALAAAFSLYWLNRRSARQMRKERLAFAAPAIPLLDEATLAQDDVDYPRIEGRFAGRPARIELHLDIIAMRKLPSLWLMVTVGTSIPAPGRLSVLMRPRNLEYWSPFDGLEFAIERPPHWPEHAHIRASSARAARLASLIEPHLDLLADARAKEILITEKGVRLVWLAAEGDRGTYLVTRQATFAGAHLAVEPVRSMLERAAALATAIEQRMPEKTTP